MLWCLSALAASPVTAPALILPAAPGERDPADDHASSDPVADRYVFGPSGFALGRGHAVITAFEMSWFDLSYGLTDAVDLHIGTSPLVDVFPGMQMAVAGVRLSVPVADNVRPMVTTDVLWAPGLKAVLVLRWQA